MNIKIIVARWIALAAVLATFAPQGAAQEGIQGWKMPTGQENPYLPVQMPQALPTQAKNDAVSVDVSGLYNKHLATSLTTTMAGATIYVAGQFLRDLKTAYVCLSSPRLRQPMYFNLFGLLDNEVEIKLGGTAYKITIDWSVRVITNQLAAEVKISPQGFSATLQQLLDSTFAAGRRVDIGGVEHRVAYYSELTGSLQGSTTSQKTYALMSRDPNDPKTYFTYLFPEEDLTSGNEKTYSFRDRPFKTMKVTLSGSTLQIQAFK